MLNLKIDGLGASVREGMTTLEQQAQWLGREHATRLPRCSSGSF
jgi:hypothetical protein